MNNGDTSDKDELLDVTEIANLIYFSERSTRQFLQKGKIKGARRGKHGKWLTLRSEVERFKKEMMFNSKALGMFRQPVAHMIDDALRAVIDYPAPRFGVRQRLGRKLVKVTKRLLPLCGHCTIVAIHERLEGK